MAPHPPVRPEPVAIWRGENPQDTDLQRDPAVFPYRPDWFVRANRQSPEDPRLLQIAIDHPSCALALLCRDFSTHADKLFENVASDGESVFHLLRWARREEVNLSPQQAKDCRATLLLDSYWGYRHARENRDPALLSALNEQTGEERFVSAGAAAFHLFHHPSEPIAPYQEVLRQSAFYMYLALPRLSHRGFTVGPSDAPNSKWACHFGLSAFSRNQGDYLPKIRADPAWLVEYLHARDGQIDPSIAAAEIAQLARQSSDHPLFNRARAVLEADCEPSAAPLPLTAGQEAESRALGRLQRDKNTALWRPTPEQINSPEFKRIVGAPRYTQQGYAQGTIMDSVDGEFTEIKSGDSVLGPTYQLRLQAYRALVEAKPLRIYTDRPVEVEFGQWLKPLGVAIEPLPE